ncbi:hypothetical protein F511_46300 [Dorcoceras hygrometricum]|uniref:Uncharacterized protein n=1 Tax=Dorcoceras hygrometricum TaxID=472368 RepID=A0A2Z6ZTW4_9LAMI|nr:hypothetical protein F511_46300 [Dorcoceras hygrometricum]
MTSHLSHTANAKSGTRQATSYRLYSTCIRLSKTTSFRLLLRTTHSCTRGSDLDTQILLKLKPKTKPILTTLPIHLRGVFSKSGLQLLTGVQNYLALTLSSLSDTHPIQF